MNKIALYVQPAYQGNRIFEKDNPLNRDNCLVHWRYLKEEFSKKGFDFSTQDINSIEESKYVLYNDMPKVIPTDDKSFLLLNEPSIIRPDNWDLSKHQAFKKIFTWNDDIIDNKKYIKVFHSLSSEGFEKYFDNPRKKLCTIIAGNKSHPDPNELYSERKKAIVWFEKNHPEDFDFYGMGWTEYFFQPPFKKLNKFTFLKKMIPVKKYNSYQGKVKEKMEAMSYYDFSICYENSHGTPGYITEKIFDSFFAGTIPIYWGAPNIKDFIPANCFIDKQQFTSYELLYDHIKKMSDEEKQRKREAIKDFIVTSKIEKFAPPYFSKIVIGTILDE